MSELLAKTLLLLIRGKRRFLLSYERVIGVVLRYFLAESVIGPFGRGGVLLFHDVVRYDVIAGR